MEKEFVPYEQALDLKELGFNNFCLGKYRISSNRLITEFEIMNTPEHCLGIDSPLYQQAFDFLRLKYNLYGLLIPTINMSWTFKIIIVVEEIIEVPPYKGVHALDYSSYNEAQLEMLKEIIKSIKER